MQLWEAQHARAGAMLRLDDGDLPGARHDLDLLIAQLTSADRQFQPELAYCYVDRATVARFANDWEGVLADVAAAETLAGTLPFIARGSVLPQVHLLRAKIHSTRFSRAFDLERAQAALDQLATMWRGQWMVEELESHIAFQRGEWQHAADKALNAASMLEREGWARGVAACRRRAGEALLELGRLDGAALELLAALDFFEKHGPPDLLGETRLALARVESSRANHDAAWALAEEALAEVESRVRRFADVAEQQRFLVDKLRFYDHAFDIGLAGGAERGWLRAWTAAERSKSFYLAHLLANADVPLFDGIDPDVVRSLQSLELALDACERRLGLLASDRPGGAEEQKLEVRLRELSDERSAMLRSIMQSNPRWARLRNPGSFNAAAYIERLPADVTPVGFFWRASGSTATLHVFSRSSDRRPLHTVVTWPPVELDALRQYGQRLHGDVDEYGDIFPEGTTDRVLPPELRDELPADACLLLSPHGYLRGLPLHALPLAESLVIARWPVQYVPSLALPSTRDATPPDRSVLLLGSSRNGFGDPPLNDVESELAELEQLWRRVSPNVVMKLLDAAAAPQDEGLPVDKWSRFGVLHFACHGRFFDQRPLDSALRLGREALRGSELFATKLNASVVGLSACALGQRSERYGDTEVVTEEWIGLYLPLFYAGARSLLVSLWDANSQVARQFMVLFHEALASGSTPHVAFRAAVLGVSRKLPARWANWCLVGLPFDAPGIAASRS